MKSGSLRLMPGRPKLDHALRNVAVDDLHQRPMLDRGFGDLGHPGALRQFAEHLVEHNRQLIGVDVADHRDLETLAGEQALAETAQIVRR